MLHAAQCRSISARLCRRSKPGTRVRPLWWAPLPGRPGLSLPLPPPLLLLLLLLPLPLLLRFLLGVRGWRCSCSALGGRRRRCRSCWRLWRSGQHGQQHPLRPFLLTPQMQGAAHRCSCAPPVEWLRGLVLGCGRCHLALALPCLQPGPCALSRLLVLQLVCRRGALLRQLCCRCGQLRRLQLRQRQRQRQQQRQRLWQQLWLRLAPG